MSKERFPYSFATLRYVHDVVTEEFVNVGVALYSRAAAFVGATFTTSYQRIVSTFGSFDGQFYRHLVRRLEDSFEELQEHLFRGVQHPPDDIADILAMTLPKDDSSLQFSATGGGLTDDPDVSLRSLFDRYVNKYTSKDERETRTDQEVLRKYKQELKNRNVLEWVQPKTIKSKTWGHTFPWAWKNGVWTACEAVSFDLVTPDAILGKANRWRGGIHSLRDDGGDFKVYLLLGEPSNPDLRGVYEDAYEILQRIPGEHELFSEDETRLFAERAAEEVRRAVRQPA